MVKPASILLVEDNELNQELARELLSMNGINVESAYNGQEALEFQWNPDDLPYLGFWMNQGGWSGSGSPCYHNLGIEPATAPCDSLEEAVKKGWARSIAPGETCNWDVKVTLQRKHG